VLATRNAAVNVRIAIRYGITKYLSKRRFPHLPSAYSVFFPIGSLVPLLEDCAEFISTFRLFEPAAIRVNVPETATIPLSPGSVSVILAGPGR
jgi:hypothetical protein